MSIYYLGGTVMKTAKLFKNGESQAVRLPKEVPLSRQRGAHKTHRECRRVVAEGEVMGDIDGESRQVSGGLHGDSRAACGHRSSETLVMKWMLDTDTCIAIIKGKPASVLKKLRGKLVGQVGISSITLGACLWPLKAAAVMRPTRRLPSSCWHSRSRALTPRRRQAMAKCAHGLKAWHPDRSAGYFDWRSRDSIGRHFGDPQHARIQQDGHLASRRLDEFLISKRRRARRAALL